MTDVVRTNLGIAAKAIAVRETGGKATAARVPVEIVPRNFRLEARVTGPERVTVLGVELEQTVREVGPEQIVPAAALALAHRLVHRVAETRLVTAVHQQDRRQAAAADSVAVAAAITRGPAATEEAAAWVVADIVAAAVTAAVVVEEDLVAVVAAVGAAEVAEAVEDAGDEPNR
jgi:hypothetical protein